ncbi:hypothetical protein SUGI_0948680 [Cryptomeria japonica]|nr:hypothetical protein SUGI_0948680 [Cryptomeria japonica]
MPQRYSRFVPESGEGSASTRAERAVPQRYSRFVPECLNVAFPLICKEVFDHGTYSARAWEGGCRVCGIWRSAIILIQASCHKVF